MSETIGKATIHNMDCMTLLKETPDKFYDLAIVDPPYGIGMGGGNVVILKLTISNLLEVIKQFLKRNILLKL